MWNPCTSAPPSKGHLVRLLQRNRSGSVGIVFALALVPLVASVGAALDYTRTARERASLQSALDRAVLAGAKDGSEAWTNVALKVFSSYASSVSGSVGTPVFSKSGNAYVGAVTESVPTTLMNVVGVQSIDVTVRATAASKMKPDNSCILTFDTGQAKSHSGMTFNGAPNVSLTGCSLRSNTSITCNGHSTNAQASIAAGTASGCSNPQSGAVVPDVWAALATNINALCSAWPGATWSTSTAPTSPKMITVQKGSYTEYHVCGDLTLSGSGSLSGLPGNSDSIIVIENGSLIMAANASITLNRTAIVLTGDNSKPSKIDFPNGNGKAATLTVSPVEGSPWKGVSIYQDPKLTDVAQDFGPGATLNFDGLVYLPKAEVTMSGNAGGWNPACSKLVVKTFTSNGSVQLSQTAQGCATLGFQQASTADGGVVLAE